jgi:hypothetical protein
MQLFGGYGYLEMTRFLIIFFFSYAGYLLVAPFMVFSTTCEKSLSIYGGVYQVGRHEEGYFYSTWMTCNLRIGPPSP